MTTKESTNNMLSGLPTLKSLSLNPVLAKLKTMKSQSQSGNNTVGNNTAGNNTAGNKADEGVMLKLKNLESRFTQVKRQYVIAYKELIELLKDTVRKEKPKNVWSCRKQDNGQYHVYCNGEFAKTDGFGAVYNTEQDCNYTINDDNGYVKKTGLQCKTPVDEWTNIVDMNYAATLINQGESTKDWTYLNKHDSLADCKSSVNKTIGKQDKPLHGIVYFNSEYPTDAFKRDCYGKIGGGRFNQLPEKHVTTAIPKHGTTMYGGKHVEKKLIVLRGLNQVMQNILGIMRTTIDQMYPIAEMNNKKLKTQQTTMYDNINSLEEQRREINKMMNHVSDSDGAYAQEKLNLTMEQAQLFGVSLLAIGGLAVTYRLMTNV